MRSEEEEHPRSAAGESAEAERAPEIRSPEGRSGRVDASRAWRVHGRVQGVGFRWWTQRTGARLGLRGWVANCRDGTVEVRAAGAPDALATLGRALEEGPPHAVVERVDDVVPWSLSIRAVMPDAQFIIER